MGLRLSGATKNDLIYGCFEPISGYDAGYTNDPEMDAFLFEQEALDLKSMDTIEENERLESYQRQEEFNRTVDWFDYDWYDMDDYMDYEVREPLDSVHVEPPPPVETKLLTISEIMRKHLNEQ